MLKSCQYCGKLHKKGYECPKKPKPKPRHRDRRNKEKFRSTAAWQKTRNAIVFRDMGLCQICFENGDYNSENLEVHHITPLAEDFSRRLDRYNLITLCCCHHKQADDGQISAERLFKIAERNEENETGDP